jgi:hypothetical protein
VTEGLREAFGARGAAEAERRAATRMLILGNRCGGITYKFCARVEMMSSVAD